MANQSNIFALGALLAAAVTLGVPACSDSGPPASPDAVADVGADTGGAADVDSGEPDASPDPAADTLEPASDSAESTGDAPGCQLVCELALDVDELPGCDTLALDEATCTCLPATHPDLTPCDDGDPCTSEDRCTGAVCAGTALDPAIACDDGDACTEDTCDPDDGCVHLPGLCDPDVACPASPETCESFHGDGDPCTGSLICVADACVVAPDSVLGCPASDGCSAWTCDPALGGCVPGAIDDGTPCTDGDPCTVADACAAGVCLGEPTGVPECACEDGDAAACAWLDDDNACNGAPTCQGGVCATDLSLAPDCDPSTTLPCYTLYCDPDVGACKSAVLPDGTGCLPIADKCALAGTCSGAICEATESLDCSDLDATCAVGACDPATGECALTHPLTGQPCASEEPCAGSAVCEGAECKVVSIDLCDDLDACTFDSCDPVTGCVHEGPPAPACLDQGVCAAGVPLQCVDGDHYVCDLAGVTGYAAIELCDGFDNDCDGLTDEGDCVDSVGCGVGVLQHDYKTGMQACASPSQLWVPQLCAPGWSPCTWTELTDRAASQPVPNRYWLAARAAFDGASWSAQDTPGAGCQAFEGACGQAHSVQAMTWYALWKGVLPLAAEAWGCQLGEPTSSCGQIALDGVMCCSPAPPPETPPECDDGELCDGIDNDCDGLTDSEDAVDLLLGDPQPCELSAGLCAQATKPLELCVAGAWLPCTAETYQTALGDDWQPEGETRCDGHDNDCDGLTDAQEPTLAAYAPLCPKQSGPCAGSITPLSHCIAGAWQPCDFSAYVDHYPAYNPTEELVCDAQDNDCDGVTDEPFTYKGAVIGGACDGEGACGPGVVQCAPSGDYSTCSSNPDGTDPDTSPEDTCDGVDEDCDGETDEELSGEDAPCLKAGVCNPQQVIEQCIDGEWDCDYSQVESYEADEELSCDDLDNDCDGEVDEPFTWDDPISGQALHKLDECGTEECPGLVICHPWLTGAVICTTELPGVELCDDEDNDCDGEIDEGLAYPNPPDGSPALLGDACEGHGECGAGTVECGGMMLMTCDSNADGSQSDAKPEVCNGKDDDCDQLIDEDFTYFGLAIGQACPGKGECGWGTVECDPNPQKATCSTNPWASNPQAKPEVCNGKDDDCDNQTDEGLGYADSTCKKGGVCTPQTVVATCAGIFWLCDYISPVYSGDDEIGWCDGLDNDCDGLTDEDYPKIGGACDGPDLDQCDNGIWLCNSHHDGVECISDQPQVELCATEADDDCDGQPNEPNAADCSVYWVDDDDDGYGDPGAPTSCQCPGYLVPPWTAPAGGDCCELDTDVHPNQLAYSTGASLCGGFDFDCDQEATPEWPGLGGCDGCTWTPGWSDAVPACGAGGTFVTGCHQTSCLPLTAPKTQGCR